MSREMAQSFVAKVASDADFRSKFAGFGSDVSDLLLEAGRAGYSFTADEYRATLAEMTGELSEADLEAVTGGTLTNMSGTQNQYISGNTINWGAQP
jgi:predicted ribosomally synthesized peptide with nif11-like leader